MSFDWPTIAYNDCMAFVGPRGSGKTELARALLKTRPHAIIVDTKRNEDWTDVGEVVDEREIFRVRGGRYIYRVEPDFLIDETRVEKFFRWALRGGNRIIYIDEQYDVLPTDGERILATQGRASGIGLWSGMQRPHGCPLYVLSEASHVWLFGLRLKRDRERVEEVTGSALPWRKLLSRKYAFVHVGNQGEISEPTILALEERNARISVR
jgi:energy-coupling factor transporter ATP-binding protein EcfA2